MNETHARRSRGWLARALSAATATGTALALTLVAAPATAAPVHAPENPQAQCGPISVAYVEVNNDSIGNVGSYVLENGSNAFDVAVIFAANLNYDGTSAQLYFNDNVQRTLDDRATIHALQKQGIKVTLSILGNHQGAGLANFESKEAAENFADQVAAAVKRYKLDGVDLDDEYSEYGNNGTGQPNDESIGWLISSLREDMPNKIISYYNIGPSAESLAQSSPAIGSQLTYATNPYYGTYSAPQIPGLDDSRLSAAAVDIQGTPVSTAASLAQRTIDDGYGVFMTYNLPGGDQSDYISAFTERLYGQAALYSPDASNAGKGHRSGCETSLVDGVLYKSPMSHGYDRH